MSKERKIQEEERKKKTEERIVRQNEKDILKKTKKERRQKELAKKLKGQSHVSCCLFVLFVCLFVLKPSFLFSSTFAD